MISDYSDDEENESVLSIGASAVTESAASALISFAPLEQDLVNPPLLSLEALNRRIHNIENELNNKIMELETENEELSGKFKKLENDRVQKIENELTSKIMELERENENLSGKFKKLENDKDELITRIQKIEIRENLMEPDDEVASAKIEELEQEKRLTAKIVESLSQAAQEASKTAFEGIISLEELNQKFNTLEADRTAEINEAGKQEQSQSSAQEISKSENIETERTTEIEEVDEKAQSQSSAQETSKSENIETERKLNEENGGSVTSLEQEKSAETLTNKESDIPLFEFGSEYLKGIDNRVEKLEKEKRMNSRMVRSLIKAVQEAAASASQGVNEALDVAKSASQGVDEAFERISILQQSRSRGGPSEEEDSARALNQFTAQRKSKEFVHEMSVTALSEDTFALMKIQGLSTTTYLFSYFIYTLQILLLAVVLAKPLASSDDPTIFDVPFRVDWYTQIGQFLAIILIVATSKDVVMPFRELSILWISNYSEWKKLLYQENLTPKQKINAWMLHVLLPNILQIVEGLAVFLASYIIILQSEDIFDLFKDFAAMQIIAELDNAMFWLADHAYFGTRLKNDCTESKRLKFKDEDRNICFGIKLRPFITAIIFITTIAGFIPITIRQQNGQYFRYKYPRCDIAPDQIEFFKDNNCDGGIFNSYDCGFDGGDCVDFNLAYPGCKVAMPTQVGDGICQQENNNEKCGFDGGDCCYSSVQDSEFWGDGFCNGGFYNTPACLYDLDDCQQFLGQYLECNHQANAEYEGVKPTKLGDGVCDLNNIGYLNDECGWEFGDCLFMRDVIQAFEEQYPGCDYTVATNKDGTNKIGDGICDQDLATLNCNWDGYDCCDGDQSLIGNAECDVINLNEGCGWDDYDCCTYFYTNSIFKDDFFNDGYYCDPPLDNKKCAWDGNDCADFMDNFPGCDFSSTPKALFGNGQCDSTFNNTECGFDGGDCSVIGVDFRSNYTFYPFMDSLGGDINIINSLEIAYEKNEEFFAQKCDADSACQGFSSDGELKYSIKDQSEWTWVTYDKLLGLYVKKNDTMQNLDSMPSIVPSDLTTYMPSNEPSDLPSIMSSRTDILDLPSIMPTMEPSELLSILPSIESSGLPSIIPSTEPSELPSSMSSTKPSELPSSMPSTEPSE